MRRGTMSMVARQIQFVSIEPFKVAMHRLCRTRIVLQRWGTLHRSSSLPMSSHTPVEYHKQWTHRSKINARKLRRYKELSATGAKCKYPTLSRRPMESQGTCPTRRAPLPVALPSLRRSWTTTHDHTSHVFLNSRSAILNYLDSCSHVTLAILHSWPCIFHGSSSHTYTYNCFDPTIRSPRRS